MLKNEVLNQERRTGSNKILLSDNMRKFYKRKQMLGLAVSAALLSNSLVVGNAMERNELTVEDNELKIESGNGDSAQTELENGYYLESRTLGVSPRASVDAYKVTTDSLNVRSGPSTSYSILGSLKKGTIIEVQSISSGWAKFNFNGKTAYVSSSYLEKVSKYKVTTDSLNVRSGPSTSYSILGSLKKGTIIEVQSISSGWAKFNFNGKTAYVSSSYLEKTTSSSSSNENTSTGGGSGTSTSSSATVTADVNLREKASWNANKLLVIKKGSAVEVVSKDSTWTKVKYSGKTGYVANEYIKASSGSSGSGGSSNSGGGSGTSTSSSATVTADVNLREKASWNANKLLVIKKGSAVEVVSKDSTWTKVKYSGKTGYVANEYIKVSSGSSGSGGSSNSDDNTEISTMVTIKDATYLRSKEDWNSTKLLLLEKGTKVKFISKNSSWVKVEHAGKTGYVSSDYVTNIPSENTGDNADAGTESTKKYKVTTDSLNVRSGPSTSYDILGSVKRGEVIEVYSITSGWAKIKYGSKTAYVSASYIEAYSENSGSNTNNSNKIIFLDPGHGGSDPGAIGTTYGTKEKEAVLAVTHKLINKLQSKGYKVVYSRNTDVYVPLADRASKANNAKSSIFVSIHFNSATSSSATGIETLYKVDGRTSNVLADKVQKELISKTGLRDRGLKQRSDLRVLNSTTMPAILVEGGFLSNSNDENSIKNDAFREKIANAIVDGIDAYFKVQK